MRKVLYSLIVLAILVGMLVCVSAPAFADEGPKDLAIVAVADAELTADHVSRIKEAEEGFDVLVIDINGLSEEQSGDEYDYVYTDAEKESTGSYQYIWPGMETPPTVQVTDAEGANKCNVVLLPIGAEADAEAINGIVSTYNLEGETSFVIAIAPQGANVDAAVSSQVNMVLTCGETSASDPKVVKVAGEAENPVSVIQVTETGLSGEAVNMPLPEAAPVEQFQPQTCTVSFAAGAEGAEGSMDAAEATIGSSYVLPDCGYTLSGSHFVGWYCSQDGYNHNVGESCTVNGDVTYTAQWEADAPQTYTVTYEANGGGGAQEQTIVTAGEPYTFPECTFTAPEGQQFGSWYEEVDWVDHQPGDTLEISADMTVQAVWNDVPVSAPMEPAADGSYTVTYKADDKPDVVDTVPLADAEGYILRGGETFQAPAENKTFGFWKSDVPGEESLELGAYNPYPLTGDVTFTAQWNDVYTVTFEANGGSGEMAPEKVTALTGGATEYGLPDCAFTAPEGNRFVGWKANDGTETIYTPAPEQSVTYPLTGDVTFTAQWEMDGSAQPGPQSTDAPMHTAYFESGIEGIETVTQEARLGSPVSLDVAFVNMPDGKAISGWKLKDDESGKIYGVIEQYTMPDSDVTFIAQWSNTSATVTYVADNGTDTTTSEPVELLNGSASYKLIALPENFTVPEGKTFGGWLVSEGNIQQPETTVTVTADMQIKAVWNDAAKQQNQDPGATSTGDVNYTQASNSVVTLSYTNASIAAVFVDNAQLVPDQDYTLAADGKSFTFINGYLNKLTVATHTLNVTFQESDTATYISNTRSLVIAAAPVVTEAPVQQPQNLKIEWSDRSASVSQTFASAPVKVEIYYGEQANADGSKTPVYREAVRDRDYTVNGNTLTLLPGLINGNWGLWPNATYSLRVTLEDNGIALAAANGTVNNPVTLQISLSGATPSSNPSPTPSAVPGNPNVPVTGDETPIVLYIVLLVVLIAALAGVLIFVMKRRNAGGRGRH